MSGAEAKAEVHGAKRTLAQYSWGLKRSDIAPLLDLDIHLFGDRQRIIDFDTEIPDGALHLCMPKQKLNRSEIAGSFIYQ